MGRFRRILKAGGRALKKRYYRKGHLNVGKIVSDVKYLKDVVNVERKTFDTNVATAFSSTVTTQCLNLIAQGNDYNNRQGNSIKASGLSYNIYINKANATNAYDRCRLILFIDKKGEGATPAITDLLESNSFYSLKNHTNRDRFKIIKDMRFSLDNSNNLSRTLKGFIRLKQHIKYQNTTGAIGSTDTNQIWLFYLSDNAANGPVTAMNFRLRFIDN